MSNIKKNLKSFTRAVIFTLIFALIFVLISGTFIPRSGTSEDGMGNQISNAYRGEEPNTIDAVFIGNSDIYRAVSPVDLYEETGITSAVAGKPKRTMNDIPANIKDILKYQHPKVILVDTDCAFVEMNSEFQKKGTLSKYSRGYGILSKGIQLLRMAKRNFKNGDSAIIAGISFYYPLIKYHDSWKHMKISYFFDKAQQFSFANKGMAYSNKIKPYEHGQEYMGSPDTEAIPLGGRNDKAINRIQKLCSENDINLVFITVPSANTWNYGKHKAIQQAADKYGIEYYDYNINTPAGFDWTVHSKDGGNHLNYDGARIITSDLGNRLKNSWGVKPMKLNQRQQTQWENDYEHFHTDIVKPKAE